MSFTTLGLGLLLSVKTAGTSAIKTAGDSIKDLGGQTAETTQKLKDLKKMAVVGAAIAGAGAVMAAGLAKAVSEAGKFQASLTEVKTLVDGPAKAAIQGMTADILQLAIAAGEEPAMLNKALYQVVSANITDAGASLEFLKIATDSATGGLSTTETAVKALTGVIDGYKIKINSAAEAQEVAGHVADMYFTAVRLGKTTFEELAPVMGKLSAQSLLVGLSMEDMFASVTQLTKIAPTSEAVTYLQSILGGLTKQTSTAKDAAKLLGIDMSTTAVKTQGWTKWVGGLDATLKNLSTTQGENAFMAKAQAAGYVTASGEITESGKKFEGLFKALAAGGDITADALGALFGRKEAIIGMSALLGDGIGTLNKFTDAMENSAGASGKAAEEMRKTWDSTTKSMGAAASGLLITIGTPMLEMLTPIVGKIRDVAAAIVAWGQANPETMETIVQITAAVSAFLIVVGGTMAAVAAVGALSVAFGALGITISAALWPVTLVVLAIAALGAIGYALYLMWDQNLWGIKDAWDAVWGGAELLLSQVSEAGKQAIVLISEAWDAGTVWISAMFHKSIRYIVDNFAILKAAGGEAWDWISDKFTGGIEAIKGAWASFGSWFTDTLWPGIVNLVTGLFTLAGEAGASLYNAIAGFAEKSILSPIRETTIHIPVVDVDIKPFEWLPEIPQMARGGIAYDPMVAAVAESGNPELMLPLKDDNMVRMAERMLSGDFSGGGQGSNRNYNQTINSPSPKYVTQIILDGKIIDESQARRRNDRMGAMGIRAPFSMAGIG